MLALHLRMPGLFRNKDIRYDYVSMTVIIYNSALPLIASSSTSNIKSALGGMTPPAPLLPYPRLEGMFKVRFSPTHISSRPLSQPWITMPWPIVNVKGLLRSRLESNFFPEVNLPV